MMRKHNMNPGLWSLKEQKWKNRKLLLEQTVSRPWVISSFSSYEPNERKSHYFSICASTCVISNRKNKAINANMIIFLMSFRFIPFYLTEIEECKHCTISAMTHFGCRHPKYLKWFVSLRYFHITLIAYEYLNSTFVR